MKPSTKEKYMYFLGGIIVLAIIVVVILLILHPVPSENKDTVYTLVGQFATLAVVVVTYFFGSSKSSADKTELLAKGKENENQ